MRNKLIKLLFIVLGLNVYDCYADDYTISRSNDSTNIETFIQELVAKNQLDSLNVIQIKNEQLAGIKIYKLTFKRIVFISSVIILVIIGLVLIGLRQKRIRECKKQLIKSLSIRELLVAELIQLDKQNKQIADELCISLSTVKTHINNIYKKLKIKDRHELKNINFSQEKRGLRKKSTP
jgi:DNA-binding NarL/FixJ family response regulator